MNNGIFTQIDNATDGKALQPISADQQGKVYADVPLSFFANVDELKNYVIDLKKMGVNVLLILPHFLPSFSPYVVKNYEKPCALFGTWEKFGEFMKFVADQGLDRMIDIPFNHADWQADNLKREWFINHEDDGEEAGADDVDADNKRVRINWGAFTLDNANKELQQYWLNNVIYPHMEKLHVNAIRIDAAWGLDLDGLKTIIGETKKRYEHSWFLAENLGMAPLVELAESGIEAGSDRFFNNFYWYEGGIYIPADVYKLYKRSKGMPTCTIYSSHDVLMPAMKALAKIRSSEITGLNDKAIVRKFVQYEKTHSVTQLDEPTQSQIIKLMKLDYLLAALMSSDVMFAAGSERVLFERIDVLGSNPESFARGIKSDIPEFMSTVNRIKHSFELFNTESVVIPFGCWKLDESGIKGYIKTSTDRKTHALVVTNTDLNSSQSFSLPRRMRNCTVLSQVTADSLQTISLPENHSLELKPGCAIILIAEDK